MKAWELNEAATLGFGLVTETLDSETRDAMVNLTTLGDGTCVVSLSLHLLLPADGAREFAVALLAAHEAQAVPA